MKMIPAYAATSASTPLEPFQSAPRNACERCGDRHIFCGVCHSDLHQARGEWGGAIFRWSGARDRRAGRGDRQRRDAPRDRRCRRRRLLIDSCRECPQCQAGIEQYCDRGFGATTTVVSAMVRRPSAATRPARGRPGLLLRIPPACRWIAPRRCCARHHQYSRCASSACAQDIASPSSGWAGSATSRGKWRVRWCRGHVLSTSPSKRDDALALGRARLRCDGREATFRRLAGRFDLISDGSRRRTTTTLPGLLKSTAHGAGRHSRQAGAARCRCADHAAPLDQRFADRRHRETQEMLDFARRTASPAPRDDLAGSHQRSYERMVKATCATLRDDCARFADGAAHHETVGLIGG